MTNPSHSVLQEAFTHTGRVMCTGAWPRPELCWIAHKAMGTFHTKHTQMWVYHWKLLYCCFEVFSVWIIQIIYCFKNICCWFNASPCFFFPNFYLAKTLNNAELLQKYCWPSCVIKHYGNTDQGRRVFISSSMCASNVINYSAFIKMCRISLFCHYELEFEHPKSFRLRLKFSSHYIYTVVTCIHRAASNPSLSKGISALFYCVWQAVAPDVVKGFPKDTYSIWAYWCFSQGYLKITSETQLMLSYMFRQPTLFPK